MKDVRTNYDDSVQNFQEGDKVLTVTHPYRSSCGGAFARGTTCEVKIISEPDGSCKTYAYWVYSDKYGYGQFYLASELLKFM
jgi:hypothetical protein